MLNSDGQSPCGGKANTTLTAAMEAGNFTPAQLALVTQIYHYGALEMARSLQRVHDLALYQSKVPIDRAEKDALYDAMVLARLLEQVEAD